MTHRTLLDYTLAHLNVYTPCMFKMKGVKTGFLAYYNQALSCQPALLTSSQNYFDLAVQPELNNTKDR